MRLKGIIFDYGGTIDTNGIHWFEVFCNMYDAAGVTLDKEALRKAYIFAEQEMERQSEQIKPTDTFKDNLQQKIGYQLSFLVRHNFLKKPTDDILNKLVTICYDFARRTIHAQSFILAELAKKYSLIVVSNFYGNLQSVLADFEITQYFQAVIESAKVGVRKPNPEIFRLGLMALRLNANEVAVVGDSYKNDIAPAQQIGCTTIWLKGIGWSDEEDNSQTADYIINELSAIFQILNES